MRKTPLAIAALLLGAGAVYFLDPRQGAQRRSAFGERVRGWIDAATQGASRQVQAASEGMHGLQRRWQERGQRLRDEDDGLEPLSMTPPPLESDPPKRSKVLPALAVATPVAVAVGAALLRQRDEEGQWLH